jgi:hypothetical protein
MKKHIERNGQTYRVSVNYSKGGFNMKQGYHLYVTPVELSYERGFEIETVNDIFSTKSVFLLEVTRQSKKKQEEAEKLASAAAELLIDMFEAKAV